MSSNSTESRSGPTVRSSGRSARSVPLNGAKSGIGALQSAWTDREPAGSATTAAGAEGLAPAAIAYASSRGISAETLARLGAASGTVFFHRLERKSEAVFFPYHQAGEVVNWKACAYPEKAFTSKPGGKLCFHGIDDVLAAEPGDVWLVEGEWDRASLVEAGISHERVLSVPNGAREPQKAAGERSDLPEGSGYGYVLDALERGLGRHKRFIWCGDNDGPGFALRQDMARLLGQARFWFVEWPEGCKDANDYLRSDGPEAVRELVTDGIRMWPVAGLYALSELPELSPLDPWHVPAMPTWRGRIALAPGTMSVVVGHPGHGKTALWGQVWHDVANAYDLVVAAASFEQPAKPYFRRRLRTLQSGKLERDMDDAERAAADRWIADHYVWIMHPDQKPTLTWFLDMAEVAVVRRGAKVIQLDPWNRLESQREPRESETDYIGRCLTALYVFATDMNCHVQVVAHPAKSDGQRRGKPPDLEDAAGSKHFDNRVDQGFVVHRPKMFDGPHPCTEAVLFHRKARFEELGHPCKLPIRYDYRVARFVEVEKNTVVQEGNTSE